MKKLLMIFAALAVVLCFLAGVSRLDRSHQAEDIRRLEDTLRRTAVACYAAEGSYPPDVAYMRQHYGLQYDEQRFAVHYEAIASNLMPQITVLEK